MSDIVTNIIRGHLIAYTQDQCDILRIPLTSDVISAPYWDREESVWTQARTDLLLVDDRQILLVPKSAVSLAKAYTRDRYHRQFVVPVLKDEHLRRRTKLVQSKRLRSGRVKEWVKADDVVAHEKSNRLDYIINFTERHPNVFKAFKTSLPNRHIEPLLSAEIERRADVPPEERTSLVEVSEHLISECTVMVLA